MKSRVKVNHPCTASQSFSCNVGVRQGENLSPLLFAIYLNDLTEIAFHSYHGLTMISEAVHSTFHTNDAMVILRLYLLRCADDTILLAESSHELQAALHEICHYRIIWKIEINVEKTKIIIYSNGQLVIYLTLYTAMGHRSCIQLYIMGTDLNYTLSGKFQLCKKAPVPASTRSHVLRT